MYEEVIHLLGLLPNQHVFSLLSHETVGTGIKQGTVLRPPVCNIFFLENEGHLHITDEGRKPLRAARCGRHIPIAADGFSTCH